MILSAAAVRCFMETQQLAGIFMSRSYCDLSPSLHPFISRAWDWVLGCNVLQSWSSRVSGEGEGVTQLSAAPPPWGAV